MHSMLSLGDKFAMATAHLHPIIAVVVLVPVCMRYPPTALPPFII